MASSVRWGLGVAACVAIYASLLACGLSRHQHALLSTGKPIPTKSGFAEQAWPLSRPSTYDVAVVLGHALDRNGRPSRVLAERVDRAVELLKRGVVKHILFRCDCRIRMVRSGLSQQTSWCSHPCLVLGYSGGHDGNGLRGRPSEAESMLRYALSDPQVPSPEDPTWMLEEGSTSTRTNALLSLEMAKERGLHSIVLVTSGFHQFRSERVFRRVAKDKFNSDGIPLQVHVVELPHEQTNLWASKESDMHVGDVGTREVFVAQLNWFREIAAIVYYFARGWL